MREFLQTSAVAFSPIICHTGKELVFHSCTILSVTEKAKCTRDVNIKKVNFENFKFVLFWTKYFNRIWRSNSWYLLKFSYLFVFLATSTCWVLGHRLTTIPIATITTNSRTTTSHGCREAAATTTLSPLPGQEARPPTTTSSTANPVIAHRGTDTTTTLWGHPPKKVSCSNAILNAPKLFFYQTNFLNPWLRFCYNGSFELHERRHFNGGSSENTMVGKKVHDNTVIACSKFIIEYTYFYILRYV